MSALDQRLAAIPVNPSGRRERGMKEDEVVVSQVLNVPFSVLMRD